MLSSRGSSKPCFPSLDEKNSKIKSRQPLTHILPVALCARLAIPLMPSPSDSPIYLSPQLESLMPPMYVNFCGGCEPCDGMTYSKSSYQRIGLHDTAEFVGFLLKAHGHSDVAATNILKK
ncbi:hypothetical protein CEXT_224551 [Caerostris extrusa]|uniref:Uncharacterized protein n=1 Tax=Caerostris extrusa TaxID=172846 RepID=A0AAV4M5V4_CAEEX|nr:hypothetical protein CEXT_224551 [Caerostris extrusa]